MALGKSAEFVVVTIATEDAPRGIAVTPDSRTAFVANQLDDSLTVIDIAGLDYDPFTRRTRLTMDAKVNYLVHLRRATANAHA